MLLLARSLDVGGAERQLVLLAKGLKERGHSVEVAVFYRRVGVLTSELQESGVEVIDLQKKGRWDLLFFMARTIRELRRRGPGIIYSFLGGANMVATAVLPFLPKTRLVWSIRASNMDLSEYDWLHRFSYGVERRLSNSPRLIIANSSAGATFAVQNGFPASKVVVVPNGIDTSRFRPDAQLRRRQRQAFGLGPDHIALGVLARLDPQKGHAIFLRAASIVAEKAPNLRFLCIGQGLELARLRRLSDELGLGDRVTFTGEQDSVAALSALDLACSCSVWGEGFSNSIAEAMACGLPCIVTDVGDSAAIVGEAGIVVPPGSPAALAQAIEFQIRNLPNHDPARPRQRILDNFSLAAMVERTLDVLNAVVDGPGGCASRPE